MVPQVFLKLSRVWTKISNRRRKVTRCGLFVFTWGTVNAKRRKYKKQTSYMSHTCVLRSIWKASDRMFCDQTASSLRSAGRKERNGERTATFQIDVRSGSWCWTCAEHLAVNWEVSSPQTANALADGLYFWEVWPLWLSGMIITSTASFCDPMLDLRLGGLTNYLRDYSKVGDQTERTISPKFPLQGLCWAFVCRSSRVAQRQVLGTKYRNFHGRVRAPVLSLSRCSQNNFPLLILHCHIKCCFFLVKFVGMRLLFCPGLGKGFRFVKFLFWFGRHKLTHPTPHPPFHTSEHWCPFSALKPLSNAPVLLAEQISSESRKRRAGGKPVKSSYILHRLHLQCWIFQLPIPTARWGCVHTCNMTRPDSLSYRCSGVPSSKMRKSVQISVGESRLCVRCAAWQMKSECSELTRSWWPSKTKLGQFQPEKDGWCLGEPFLSCNVTRKRVFGWWKCQYISTELSGNNSLHRTIKQKLELQCPSDVTHISACKISDISSLDGKEQNLLRLQNNPSSKAPNLFL